MFGKKTAKEQMKLAQQAQQQQQQFMQQAAAPPPLQSAEDKAKLRFLDWENQTGEFAGKPLDIRNAPGMAPWLSLYDNAVAAREDEQRAGSGLFQLGLSSGSGSPEYAARLKELMDNRRRERAGGALENAYRQTSAAAHGYVLPSSSLTTQRQSGLASLASGNANNAWARAMQAQQSAGFLNSNLFNQLIQGGAAAATGGLSSLRTGGSRLPAANAGGGVWSGLPAPTYFRRGGNLSRALKRPGDTAVVGEEGPEVIGVDGRGDYQVIPSNVSMLALMRGARQPEPAGIAALRRGLMRAGRV